VLLDHFLDAAALRNVFAATLLNVHPCSYDAYGMTAGRTTHTQPLSRFSSP
jgi:hypothetical protein